MFRLFKVTAFSLLALMFMASVTGIGGYFWLRSSLPQIDGEIFLEGLENPVEIIRDENGVVTIKAQTDKGAYRALGYVHAQDRLWQMDFTRRAGSGRLSEVAGEATLRIDRFMRTLGFHKLVQANYQILSPATKELFEAYSQGVNDYIQTHSGALSPEFLIMGYTPEPWQPSDSLIWGRLMAMQLSGNFNRELLRQRLLKNISVEEVNDLWPEDKNDPLIIPEIDRTDLANINISPLIIPAGDIPLPWPLAPKDASNAWAVSGDKSYSGGAILANDPHLALVSPGPWYLVRIETPEYTWAGATAPGVPLLVLGHNSNIAWGFTTTHSDTQDLFIEKINPDNPDQYLTPNGYRDFEIRIEKILVKDGEDQEIVIRNSRHGPIMSSVLGQPGIDGSEYQLALSWTALRDDDLTAQALYDINRAKSLQDFNAAIKNFHSPQQTLVMADSKGNINLVAPGRVPIRKSGDGRRPVPGWTGEYDWLGLIPYNELPASLNPNNGILVTANNRLVGPEYPYLITKDWPNSYRARRINQLLNEKKKLSIEDNQTIQMDSLSLSAKELVGLLIEILPSEANDPDSQRVLDTLAGWDGRMELDAKEPALLYSWLYWLNRAAFGKLPTDAASFQAPDILKIKARIEKYPQNWCLYGEKLVIGGDCVAQMTEGLKRVASNSNTLTDFPSWGNLHTTHFKHQVYDRIPLIGELLKLEISTPGGHDTINRGSPSLRNGDLNQFPNIHGPSYRAVYDLNNLDNSRFLIATGQSGNPLSSYYGNFLLRWRDGNYIKLDGTNSQNTGSQDNGHRLLLRGTTNR